MRYVISDIHGNFKKFIEMLELINFQTTDILYVLGDSIDRNYGGIKILNYIKDTKNIKMLLGNHEQLLVDYLTEEEEYKSKVLLDNWIAVGGKVTINELKEYSLEHIYSLLNWLCDLPYYMVVDNYILVHGGFNMPKVISNRNDVLNFNTKNEMIWNRKFFIDENCKIEKYTVIVGHTTTISLNDKSSIIHKDGKINIDCGSGFNGRLGCICLDTMKEFYI